MTDAEKLQLVATWEREGLLPALKEGANLLDSNDGLDRHGVQGWRQHSLEELRSKAIRHGSQAGTEDEDSGMDHGTHCLVRFAMVVTLGGERG